MSIHTNIKGISIITLIVLVTLSAIIGGIISYAFTIAYYTKIPEETTLAITNVYIDKENVRSFNITILNPSYSPRNANIKRIALSLENGTQLYDVVETNPPIKDGLEILRGEAITITCLKVRKNSTDISFGEFVNTFAGETIIVHVFADDSSAANMEATLPNVKLKITADFNRQLSKSIEYFNLTIENSQPEPLMNLTISEVYVNYEVVETQPSLPYSLMPNQNKTFICKRNWDDLKWVKVKITVKTIEGYELTYLTDELPGVAIFIDEIKFDYDDTSYVNVTVTSSEKSTDVAYINRVELTLENSLPKLLNTSYPTNINIIPTPILPDQSVTLKCLWDWHSHRNKTITFTVYTKQGIKAQSNTYRTPPEILWEINGANFDLDNLEFFTISVTNKRCSQNITITNVKLNDRNVTIVNPQTIIPGQQTIINCSSSWRDLIDTNVTVSVAIADVEERFRDEKSKTVWISPVKLSILEESFVFGDFVLPNSTIILPYMNVTVHNSNNSLSNVTITKIVLEIGYEDDATLRSKIIEIDGALSHPKLLPDGYILRKNETVTFICFSNWSLYLTQTAKYLTVTIYTREGFQASKTWHR